MHSRVMNVALMDGIVRSISPAMSQTTWTNALNPADGNIFVRALEDKVVGIMGIARALD